ncbi:MAG: hypothetical protein J6Z14_04785 [Prevotella sp.]|nr:hypothetical protein [Prevotella sp.]
MNRIRQMCVWLGRLPHSRGFGVQSPTDYRFVRYVINESWPYYAYKTLGKKDHWLRKKLGKLYFRVANHLQPQYIVDGIGVESYLRAACPKATISNKLPEKDEQPSPLLILAPIQTEYQQLLDYCGENTILVLENINQHQPLWHCIEYDRRTSVTFDLYYCGIVLFDKKRSTNNYKVNF